VIHRPILSIGPSIPIGQSLQPEILSLPLAGWREQQRHDHSIVWIKGSNQLRQLELIPGETGFSGITAENVMHFRRAGRQVALDQGMGLIELECVFVANRSALRMVCKQSLEGSTGFIYLGRLIVPFPKLTISVTTQSLELTDVGRRERAIEARMLDQVWCAAKRWIRDPYDPAFDSLALCHLADAQQFDVQFPNHPLSLVRQDLQVLETETIFSDQLFDAAINLDAVRKMA
jgi:hypothetical protein